MTNDNMIAGNVLDQSPLTVKMNASPDKGSYVDGEVDVDTDGAVMTPSPYKTSDKNVPWVTGINKLARAEYGGDNGNLKVQHAVNQIEIDLSSQGNSLWKKDGMNDDGSSLDDFNRR